MHITNTYLISHLLGSIISNFLLEYVVFPHEICDRREGMASPVKATRRREGMASLE